MIQTDIPGYTYGTDAVSRSPVSLDELELLQTTLLLGEDDLAALRRSRDVLAPHVSRCGPPPLRSQRRSQRQTPQAAP
jgi:hypothetical protein